MGSRTHPVLAGLIVLVTIVVLTGCGEVTAAPEDRPGVAGDGSGIGGDYVSDGAPNPPFPDGSAPIRLTLRDGEISFTAGCNHFSGRATWDDGVLRTSALGGTEMGCPGARQEQDEWMVEFFGSSPRLELEGNDLAVRSEEVRVWFVPADEVPSGEPGDVADLVGAEWRLTHVAERDGDSVGMMVVPRRVAAPIRFDDEETRIETGCNSARGRATVSGGTVTFGRMRMTLRHCPGAAGEVEHSLLRVLQGRSTVSWSISGDQLRLVTRDGRHELVYQR